MEQLRKKYGYMPSSVAGIGTLAASAVGSTLRNYKLLDRSNDDFAQFWDHLDLRLDTQFSHFL